MPITTMAAIRAINHFLRSKGKLLSLEMRRKVVLLLSALILGRKWGRNTKPKKVLPSKPKEANSPKS